MIWLSIVLLQAAVTVTAPNPQIARGQTLFFAEKGCGNCHALKGQGTAVGPDLKVLGKIGVRALVTAIRATRTEYVIALKPKGGEEFPAMKVTGDASGAQYYDLSKMPPELRKFAPGDIESKGDNATWQHPPAKGGWTNAQLADVVAYIRWVSAGDKKPVAPDDVE
jgi:mono/diheme cytochrome c family protein